MYDGPLNYMRAQPFGSLPDQNYCLLFFFKSKSTKNIRIQELIISYPESFPITEISEFLLLSDIFLIVRYIANNKLFDGRKVLERGRDTPKRNQEFRMYLRGDRDVSEKKFL